MRIQHTEGEDSMLFRMENEDKYQALDNLKQLLHHHSDALVTKEVADGLEVRRANKVSVGAVYVGVCDVERLRGKEETDTMLFWSKRKFALHKKLQVFTIISQTLPHLRPIQVVRLYVGWLVSLRLLGEGNSRPYKAEQRETKKGKEKAEKVKATNQIYSCKPTV